MENVRNFVIIAHIDHGKSTLADRFLELTETVPQEKMRPQFLDMMDLERERGITIKMQPVRMNYTLSLKPYTLNLIDTPGHVDFSYEVSRSLAAVEGAILLVDGTRGIQAQTIANLELAKKQGLVIIPAINKIDLSNARIEESAAEIANLLGIEKSEVIKISAKHGTNVKELLLTVIKKIPPPKGNQDAPLRALIFDSKYDLYKGVIAYVRIKDGKIKKDEKIYLIAAKTEGETKEVGFFKPGLAPDKELKAGEIGYLATGVKEPGKVMVGDTITKSKIKNRASIYGSEGGKNGEVLFDFQKSKTLEVKPLPGYREPKPMVFVSIYPEDPEKFDLLREAISKLKLNDAALTFEPEMKEALGRGFRCGFLGSLHAEIVSERLQREFNLNLVISTPSVVYKIIDRKNQEELIKSATDWPENLSQVKETQEPWIRLEVMTPIGYLGRVMEVLQGLEAEYKEKKYFGQDKILLIYEAPLREVISGFYDKILGATQGFASMNYEILGFRGADLVKLEILIAGKKEEALSKIVPQIRALQEGSKFVKKLKEILPPQQFSVALQATISGKIIARETIKARRRDVTAPLYGGDYTRKRKLLERQKRGKKELKEKAQIRIPSKVFFEMLKE